MNRKPTPDLSPRYLKTGAAARYLGLSRRFLAALTQRGELPFSRVGPRCILFDRKDLDAFVQARRVEPDPAAIEG